MKQYYILEIRCRNLAGASRKYSHLYFGTAQGARSEAERYKDKLADERFTAIRVSIMAVDQTTYCGSVRG